MESFLELTKTRQSNRSYKDTAVEREKIIQIMEAARLAPSANNSQSWSFVVVDDPELINKIADAASSLGMNKFVQQAPVIITVIVEKSVLLNKIGSLIQKKDYAQIDIGIATEHICLEATELGLGSCIVGWFNEKKIKKLLQVPSNKRIVMLITIGYTNDSPREKHRKNFNDIVKWNSYSI